MLRPMQPLAIGVLLAQVCAGTLVVTFANGDTEVLGTIGTPIKVDSEVVEGGTHLLRSQVGERAGGVLARSLHRLGTAVYTGARAVRGGDFTGTLARVREPNKPA